MRIANNGADQPAYQRSLISPTVYHYFDSIKVIIDKVEVSRVLIVFVAEQTRLSLNQGLQTTKTDPSSQCVIQ